MHDIQTKEEYHWTTWKGEQRTNQQEGAWQYQSALKYKFGEMGEYEVDKNKTKGHSVGGHKQYM